MRLKLSLLESFLQYARLEVGAASATIYTYRSHVRRFLDWLLSSNGHQKLTAKMVGRTYMGHLRASAISNTTIQSHLSSLNSFFRYLTLDHEDESLVNPFAGIKRPRREPVDRRVPPFEEVVQLIECASRNPYSLRGPRDAAMIACMAYAGLRRAELTNLQLSDYVTIEIPNGADLHVIGKGQKLRIVPCPTVLIHRLEAWLKVRGSDSGALFLSIHGTPLHPKAVPAILAVAAGLAGLEPIKCHDLRHFYATTLIQRGADLVSIKELLGHSSVVTTAAYLHSETRRLRQVVGVLDAD